MGEIVGVEGAGDEAGLAVGDEVFWAALIGDDAGDAAGHRFKDDVAEGVSGAGEEKNVRGGECAGEFESGQVAGECGKGEQGAQFLEVGAVADERERNLRLRIADWLARKAPAAACPVRRRLGGLRIGSVRGRLGRLRIDSLRCRFLVKGAGFARVAPFAVADCRWRL